MGIRGYCIECSHGGAIDDCKQAKQFLGEQRISYDWIDNDLDENGREYVRRVTECGRRPQAGVTERIENYPGFLEGVNGAYLAEQMRIQAEQFGVEILQAKLVTDLRSDGDFSIVSTGTESINEFRGKSNIESVLVTDSQSGESEELHPVGMLVFVGLDPNTGFVRGTLDTNGSGFIETDVTFQSSMSGVYAASDVRAGSAKQLAAVVGEGTTVAMMVRGYLECLQGNRGYAGDE